MLPNLALAHQGASGGTQFTHESKRRHRPGQGLAVRRATFRRHVRPHPAAQFPRRKPLYLRQTQPPLDFGGFRERESYFTVMRPTQGVMAT